MANVIFKLCVLWLIISIKSIKSDEATTSSDQDRMSYGSPCYQIDNNIQHDVGYLVTVVFSRQGEPNTNKVCGGVMLNSKFGLAASDCVYPGFNHKIRLESHNFMWNRTNWGTFEVDQFFELQDNVCVFKIKLWIPTYYRINYVPLPRETLPDVLENYCPLILVAARGQPPPSIPICAKFIVKTTVERNKKKKACTEIAKPFKFSGNSKNYFCTDSLFGGASCRGDYGIGAVCVRTNELIGIVSWFEGAKCDGLTLYSRLDRQLKEINKILTRSAGCRIIIEFYFALPLFLSIVTNIILN